MSPKGDVVCSADLGNFVRRQDALLGSTRMSRDAFKFKLHLEVVARGRLEIP
jgi:hypothetical protein